MREVKTVIFGILLFASATCLAQPSLDLFLATSQSKKVSASEAQASIDEFVQSFSLSTNTERKLLHRVVRKAHAAFLKSYSSNSDFDQIFTDGSYNCLTATAFFSHVLHRMHFEFEVIETNYHIFIIIKTSEGNVLLETTDRLAGLVTDREEIAKRTEAYRNEGPPAVNARQTAYRYGFSIYRNVPIEKLHGLMTYNQAVAAYNRENWIECARLLEDAHAVYATVRCEELSYLLVRTLLAREVSEQVKATCHDHLKNILLASTATVAAN